jgi:hypothetical protein
VRFSRLHRTGPRRTSVHRFQAAAVFYPNFYPRRRHGGAERTSRAFPTRRAIRSTLLPVSGLRDFLNAGRVLQISGQPDVAQPAKDRGVAAAIYGDEDIANSADHSLLSVSQRSRGSERDERFGKGFVGGLL